ncbi:hypothetical protein BGZ74_003232, partial [Mortierella antarctica]
MTQPPTWTLTDAFNILPDRVSELEAKMALLNEQLAQQGPTTIQLEFLNSLPDCLTCLEKKLASAVDSAFLEQELEKVYRTARDDYNEVKAILALVIKDE